MSDSMPRFTSTELLLVALGVIGLVGTWAQGFHYLAHGLVAGNVLFWQETVATPASTFLVVDILVLAAAMFVLMFAEGRRVGIGTGWLWTYFLLSLFVAVSFAVPVFLAHRQRRIRLQRPAEAVEPAGSDWIAIGIAVAIVVVSVGYSLRHIP
jgi:Terpene cyclase DEP1